MTRLWPSRATQRERCRTWLSIGRGPAAAPRYDATPSQQLARVAPEDARARAKVILGSVAHGRDPAGQKTTERAAPTVAELSDRFMTEHVEPKRKRGTAQFYRDILDRIVKPSARAPRRSTNFLGSRLPSFIRPLPTHRFRPIGC